MGTSTTSKTHTAPASQALPTTKKVPSSLKDALAALLGDEFTFDDLKDSIKFSIIRGFFNTQRQKITQLSNELSAAQKTISLLERTQKNVLTNGVVGAEDISLVREKCEGVADEWQEFSSTWAIGSKQFGELDESVRGALRRHIRDKHSTDCVGSLQGAYKIFSSNVGSKIMLQAFLARDATEVLMRPFDFLRSVDSVWPTGAPADLEYGLDWVFNRLSEGEIHFDIKNKAKVYDRRPENGKYRTISACEGFLG